MKRFITTPIYYANDVPHIGHAYTTFIADAYKRYYELAGDEVILLTGTDENGQKIELSALSRNRAPKEYVDTISQKFRDTWDEFGISYDVYVRTTDSKHHKSVQRAFAKMLERGDIYKGEYEGYYCISCESYFSATQVGNNRCPDCTKEVQLMKEESYFFALSKYQDALLDFYYKNEDFILPRFRKNEVVNFIKQGLSDLSITRTSFEWGIKLPESLNEPKHIVYVWLDALLSYVSGIGFGALDDLESGFKHEHWANSIHIVGKDILRFHAIYWPAFLMSLGVELPKKLIVNGWWLKDGLKMSKSVGNVIDPVSMARKYGVDALRYFLFKEVSFGQDGDFVEESFIRHINSDLADVLGNLVSRVLGMSEKYFDLSLCGSAIDELDEVYALDSKLDDLFGEVTLHKYIETLWAMLAMCNGLIQKYEPWALIKKHPQKVADLLASICNAIILCALRVYPIMPQSAEKILSVFSLTVDSKTSEKIIKRREFLDSFSLVRIENLFPKIDTQRLQTAKNTQDETKPQGEKKDASLSISDFKKLDIRLGEIVNARKIEGSEKLYLLKVDLGSEIRDIVSGLALSYEVSELLGKRVCVIVNLKPAKLMDHMSYGMILACKDDESLGLLSVDRDIKLGSRIS